MLKSLEDKVYLFFDRSRVKVTRGMMFFEKITEDQLRALRFITENELRLVVTNTKVSLVEKDKFLTGAIRYRKPVIRLNGRG